MERNDYVYFRQREADERDCAERARDLTARRAHLDLAERYAERVRSMAPPVVSSAA
ncbi:hypothetical protein [Sphingomonas koreensis]|jgi:hypothetical protein|uniref:hypothetical protein n=1 Tax=Sphingomonas koreensis TaxID=93064 RepID=UPI000A6E6553|nr:hypothetical protein [Sphingomonas koreensis]MDC7812026.1 hypothetical protein [Sphingomonas koreensis]PJI89138.1 hypothetical protein BDW16_2445 [Sphingomonas koreensis]